MLRSTVTYSGTCSNIGASLGAGDNAQGTLCAQHPASSPIRSSLFGRKKVVIAPQAFTPSSAIVKTSRASPAQEPGAEDSAITFGDLQQLTGVFSFTHLPTATEQSKPSWLLSKFEAWLQAHGTQAYPRSGLSPSQLSLLQHTVQFINDPGPGLFVEWLPAFGCALLPLAPAPAHAARPAAAVLQPGHVALYLVVPDGWTFDMHSMPDKEQHTSSGTRTSSLYCGHVPAQQYQGLVAAMHAAIQEQKALKQEEKKGLHGGTKSCYQCTPAFILSAIQVALAQCVQAAGDNSTSGAQLSSFLGGSKAKQPFPPPRGGFTDVGLHTGGQPKATTWPVLQSMIKVVLPLCLPVPAGDSPTAHTLELQLLFDKAMMLFELWVLQQLQRQLMPATAVPAAVDACMTVLQSAAGKAAALAVNGVDVTDAEAACAAARQLIYAAVLQRQRQAAAVVALPRDATVAAGAWWLPTGTLPAELPATPDAQGLQAALDRQATNLASRDVVDVAQPMSQFLQQLLVALRTSSGGSDVAVQHSLHTTENALLRMAARHRAALLPGVMPVLTGSAVELLSEVVDTYRVVITAFKSGLSGKQQPMLQAELRNREVLVGWVAYCLIHQATGAAHPLVLQYGVALDWQDLRHLVLTDKTATYAALGVATYLQKHTKHGQELFHLSQQQPSLSFADQYAAADSSMCSMLSAHLAAAEARMDAHYKVVQQKQQHVKQRRSELAVLRAEHSSLVSERDCYSSYDPEYKGLANKIRIKGRQISSTETQLAAVGKAPEPVIQPLPQKTAQATQWLFFLHMPQLLRRLARASCLAQQLLLPQPVTSTIKQQVQVSGLKTTLHEHYNRYQAVATYHTQRQQYNGSHGGPGYVLSMSTGSVPRTVGPDHVDSFKSREDGVWFPDSLPLTMAWQGSNCSADSMTGTFNPFAVTDTKAVVESFTAQLPAPYSSLQWAMYQYGSTAATATNRGNLGLASQDNKPDDLSKPAYLALTNLRSFPTRQLHRLCDCLRDKELPLEHPAVQLMVQQAVYHLGQLTATSSSSSSSVGSPTVAPFWRTGWDEAGGVLEALCFELQQLAAELNNKPRDQGSVLLLGQLAAYISDWHAPAKAVAQQYAAMTSRHADQQLQEAIDKVASDGSDEAALASLKANQTRWRAMALLCFAAGPLEPADVGCMLRLMLLIKHSDVYQPDRSTAAELAALRVRCHDVMARRLPDILACLDQQPQLLTDAAASILECLQQQPGGHPPPQLPWEQHSSSSSSGGRAASYQAAGSDGHLYSINVLDGTLLFDGNPPGRLPNSILQHSLYVCTFGATNHEVKKTTDGQLETIRPVQGRFYRFNLCQSGGHNPNVLVITEIDATQTAFGTLELQLLDPGDTDACPGWGEELPARLREMHSHWHDRQHGIIVFRPKTFHEHAPQFLSCCNLVDLEQEDSTDVSAADPTVPSALSCWQVPTHLQQQQHWTAVLTQHAGQLSQRQLVLTDRNSSQVLKVLSKFEDSAFIHTYMPGQCPAHLLQPQQQQQTLHTPAADRPTGSDPPVLEATGPAVPGMLWHLPRCGLQFELQTDGRIVSLDHRGYSLSRQQLLVSDDINAQHSSYTLPECQQYLVLQADQDSSSGVYGAERSTQLMLVPSGRVKVQRSSPGSTQQRASIHVQLSTACDERLKVFKYAVHGRFGYLTAACLTSRLQLAALYAASSTLLPEPASQLTGAETALMLVRHSWTNVPLTALQQQHLQDTANLGGCHAPALRLLCHDLAASAFQLQHLYVPETGEGAAARRAGDGSDSSDSRHTSTSSPDGDTIPALDPDAISEFMLRSSTAVPAGFPVSHRQQLSPQEETWLMHTGPETVATAAYSTPDWKRWHRFQETTQMPQFPVAGDYVQQAEAALAQVVQQTQQQGPPAPFPVPLPANNDVPVAVEMFAELKESWDCYQQHPEPTSLQPGALEELMRGPYALDEVSRHREAAESYLLRHLNTIPGAVGDPGTSFRLLVAAASHPVAAVHDLLTLAWGDVRAKLRCFNPFLSDAACDQLHHGVLVWLQLCVLEDRLNRVMKLAQAGEEYTLLLIRELLTQRTWDVSHHPCWLVFEAEGRLQIRPAQHALAMTLLEGEADDRGPIAQLNMGEGKTRVILPMMILELADGNNLVRVNFLSQLLPEGRAHLQSHFTASVLGVKVFELPFHRGVKVTADTAAAMMSALAYCQEIGGVLLMAPEHRNSLYLKYVELAVAGSSGGVDASLAPVLHSMLNSFPYYDILDESDEVLHHQRRQLVYAWGGCMPLPALEARIHVVQSLLLLLSKLVDHGSPILNKDGLALTTGVDADRKPGSFCGLQLLSGEHFDRSAHTVIKLLAVALADEAPLQDELGWMGNFHDKALLYQLVTERSCDALSATETEANLASLPSDKQHQVLAARGLLACGLLLHCLQSRHRVGYGVNRSKSAKKRLAVPYRAADLPAERSEFSQPDVALVYTHLAYYYDGLSKAEFKAAVEMLLSCGPSEQTFHYSRWLAQGRASGSQGTGACDVSAVDSADKVDPHNRQLMDAMWSYFSHNMEVVNFWLATCVLPLETQQYPSRLVATAWHLAHNPTGRVCGFSGTNDNHRLLPLQVQQVGLTAAPQLQGTNGKMLDMLMRHGTYGTLKLTTTSRTGAEVSKPVWQLLLHEALTCGVDAIIDCGALLAGNPLRRAAEYLLDHMPPGRYRGVTYFCRDDNCWVILDTAGSLAPRTSSHLREAETLALFDDARCRGSDLQLRQTGVGLLTLAADMPKDKLMQAAGRMRQLGRGQTLLVMGQPDITAKIAATAAAGTSAAPSASATQPLAQPSSAAAAAPATPASTASPGRPKKAMGLKRKKATAPISRSSSSSSSSNGSGSSGSGACKPDMRGVLSWVLCNTVQGTLSGIPQAASQGMQFAATYGGPPEACVLPERLSVSELYGSSKVVEPVGQLLQGVAQHYIAHAHSHWTNPSHLGGTDAAAGDHAAIVVVSTAASSNVTGSITRSGSSSASMSVTRASRGASSMSVDGQPLRSSSSSSGSTAATGRAMSDAINELPGSFMGLVASEASASMLSSDRQNSTDRLDSLQNVAMLGAADTTVQQLDHAGTAAGVDPVEADVLLIASRFSALGAGHSVLAGQGADEECERELQQEEEQEQEAEVQVPAATAAAETDWTWASAFIASSPTALAGCRVMCLSDVLRQVASAAGVRDIAWCGKVWASHNFVDSVTTSAASPGLTDYLRPVGALLLFTDSGQLLLLSEREADAVQRQLWATSSAAAAHSSVPTSAKKKATAKSNVLLSLPYLRLACSQGDSMAGTAAAGHSTAQQQRMYLASVLTTAGRPAPSPAELAAQVSGALGASPLVAVQLFAGAVMYCSAAQRALLHKQMSGRREAAQELVAWRGKLHMLPRSDLDRACADDRFG